MEDAEKPTDGIMRMHGRGFGLPTSLSQLVRMVMASSNSICTTTPQIIPNHSPWSSYHYISLQRFLQMRMKYK